MKDRVGVAAPRKGVQTIYDRSGTSLLLGEWDPKRIYSVLTSGDPGFWRGKRVLEIASNTGGLAVELARAGARVTMTEPDPYGNSLAIAKPILEELKAAEGLDLTIVQAGFYDAPRMGVHDVVICLGLIYHFRYPQYILDFLSTLGAKTLFISTQTSGGDQLALVNRSNPGILPRGFLGDDIVLTGWHPTRPLFEAMLRWAGFTDVRSLTDKPYDFPFKMQGLTNSGYYRATYGAIRDPELEKLTYYPR